jgi:hypothetical protein
MPAAFDETMAVAQTPDTGPMPPLPLEAVDDPLLLEVADDPVVLEDVAAPLVVLVDAPPPLVLETAAELAPPPPPPEPLLEPVDDPLPLDVTEDPAVLEDVAATLVVLEPMPVAELAPPSPPPPPLPEPLAGAQPSTDAPIKDPMWNTKIAVRMQGSEAKDAHSWQTAHRLSRHTRSGTRAVARSYRQACRGQCSESVLLARMCRIAGDPELKSLS